MSNSAGSLDTIFGYIEQLLNEQRERIRLTLGRSQCKIKKTHRIPVLQDLIGKCSTHALDLIYEEIAPASWVTTDRTCHTCEKRVVYNLPCAHEVRYYLEQQCPIPLEIIDAHWRKLDYLPQTIEKASDNIEGLLANLRQKYEDTEDHTQRQRLKSQIELVYDPAKTTAREPEVKKKKQRPPTKGKKIGENSTKRHPSGFEYTKSFAEKAPRRRSHSTPKNNYGPSEPLKRSSSVYEPRGHGMFAETQRGYCNMGSIFIPNFPKIYHERIQYVHNVMGDGNCGFRAIAKTLNLPNGEEGWPLVRTHMIYELQKYRDFYLHVYDGAVKLERLEIQLRHMAGNAPKYFWFELPDMGHLAASTYNVALLVLGRKTCTTYLPLRESPQRNATIICIAHVGDDHFVEVGLKPFPPLPPVQCQWKYKRLPPAEIWKDLLKDNFDTYNNIEHPPDEPKNYESLSDD